MCEDIGVTMVTNKLTIVMVTLSLKKDIESSSEMFSYLRTSSAIMLRNDCLALGQLFENRWKFLESVGKSSENPSKKSSLV